MLKIVDTLSQQKKEFKPVKPGKIGIYLCGMTVYDYCHIGHARGIIVFDIIVNYLRKQGYEVTYVHNITDIDDKIIKRANENGETCEALTERFINAMHEDEKALGILPATHEPRATQYLPQIIKLIEDILKNGYGYVADNGDVYFDVRKFKDYGKLSKRDLDKLISGARVEVNDAKQNPLDFVLWKMSKPDEPQWDSPWGKGRPGWHIECSAMSADLLGQPFDIHGGGMDLKFPHHENEIAQSEAGCGCEFVKTWMHVGLLTINDEKMSKSLNNFYTIREVLEEHSVEVIRFFMISGHYRSPVNYTKDVLHQIRASLERLYISLRHLPVVSVNESVGSSYIERFNAAMNDDFNTPEALAVLFDLSRDINRMKEQGDLQQAAEHAACLRKLADIFGLLKQDPEAFLKGDVQSAEADKIEALIKSRERARHDKNWQEADRIRQVLLEMNVAIEDSAGGTLWRVIDANSKK